MKFTHKICRQRPRLRQFYFIGVIFLWLCLWSDLAYSGLEGQACSSCHTMHNSQGGAVMTFGGQAAGNMLLRGTSCGGCHADATANTSSTMGDLRSVIPQVDATDGTNILAGGSFAWVQEIGVTDDSKRHNVEDLGIDADSELDLGFDPPGYDEGIESDINNGAATWAAQLTCAGTYGCHGDHSIDNKFQALQGAHHGNAGNDGSAVGGAGASVGGSYRFLKTIRGIEANGVWKEVEANHNVYYGVAGGDDPTTISALCAQCHGDFHRKDNDGIGTASPWLRHPTDIDMKALGGEFSSYSYSLDTPVAASDLSMMSPSSTTGNYSTQIVTCLSCHRAHGSNYDDLLRWDYRGANEGCAICHTSKS